MAAKVGPGEVAVVAGQPITFAAYDEALAEERADYKADKTSFPAVGSSDYATLQTQVVDFLVQQTEFEIEAQKLGVAPTAAAVAAQVSSVITSGFDGKRSRYLAALKAEGYTPAEMDAYFRERLLDSDLYNAVTASAKVSAAAIAAYYDENLSIYEQPESRKVREILAGKGKAALAQQIYAELKSGASFAALAKRYSQDPGTKDSGGLFTARKGEDVPGFDDAVFAAGGTTDELLRPVDTSQYGWFVIQLLGPIVPATTESEKKAAPSIAATLDASTQEQAFSRWLEQTTASFCSASSIGYATGYTPDPDPCSTLSVTNQTTT